jgi:hypothetical protein
MRGREGTMRGRERNHARSRKEPSPAREVKLLLMSLLSRDAVLTSREPLPELELCIRSKGDEYWLASNGCKNTTRHWPIHIILVPLRSAGSSSIVLVACPATANTNSLLLYSSSVLHYR